ncbi:TetR/AcrR family transcriptional regulator [Candidatus Saccharibacteria bacterium]|nr:TetR/AcrR family transcriptional regulator [Candidatus Saccharibacteria bacterium]
MKEDKSVVSVSGTKWKLFTTALDLFSKKGYANVGIREIANVVGIKWPGIYNHFENKDAFLDAAYKFYRHNFLAGCPDLDDILERIPNTSPRKIFAMLPPKFLGEDMADIMGKIILVAIEERIHDERAESLVYELLVGTTQRYISEVLSKMVELDIIEPLDVDVFSLAIAAFDIYSGSRAGKTNTMEYLEWQTKRQSLLGMVRVKNAESAKGRLAKNRHKQ